ncbi:MAG: carboxypeptidase-like regulatory domain-containing protein, partial [Candidatus Binatia bacterium]
MLEVFGDDKELAFPPTGLDGRTSAPRMPNTDINIKARKDDLVGSTSWRWASNMESEVTIWMNRDRDVEVAITDRTGAPHVGAKVGLFAAKEKDWLRSSNMGEADEAGIARIHVVGTDWLALHDEVRAVAMLGGARVPAEPTTWAEAGPTRIAIVLDQPVAPAGPTLVVRFVDKDGAPVAIKGRLPWSRIAAAGVGTWEAPVDEVPVDGTEARVTRQLLDGDHIRLRLWEEGHLESELELTLPPGAREQEVRLPRGLVAPRLEIPVVDAAGRPVTTGTFVATVLLIDGGYEHESTVQPNAQGLLELTLAEARGGKVEIAEPRDAGRLYWPEPPRLKRPYRTSIGEAPPPNPPIAVLEFGEPGPGAVLRLPAVTAPDTAPRIHGVVVDAAGAPVGGVRIWLTTVTRPEPAPFAAFATTSDAAGRFAIRATSLPDEVFVGGRRPLGFCAPLRVRPAAEPVTLVLQPTGAIAMDLREPERPAMPDEIARQLRARIDLHIDDDALADGRWMYFREQSSVFEGEWRKRWGAYGWVPEQGDLVMRDLVPGEYRVIGQVGINPVLDLQGVQVRAGETTRPAAAQGLVIGAGVEAGCVRVRDAEGRPLAKVAVRVMLPEWKPKLQQPQYRSTGDQGEAWFVVPRGALAEVELTAAGTAPQQLHDAAFPVEVTMGAGTSIDFAITGVKDVAADSRAIAVGCMAFTGAPPESPVQEIGEMKMVRHPQANLDAEGRATVPNLPPGNYRLWLGAVPPIMSKRG